MREAVQLFVEGDPKGQPRARACIRGKHAGVYDPGTADAWKQAVAEAWRSKVAPEHAPPFRPFCTAVKVILSFYIRRPKGHFGKNGLLPSAPVHHTQKPDTDNLAKAVLDVLTRLGAWTDDKLACTLLIRRQWADVSPGCSISIREEDA